MLPPLRTFCGMLLSLAFLTTTAHAIVFPLPDTAYPIPAGAIFVATNGNDANAGTAAAPLRNPATAVARVPAGGTIVFRGGSYYNVEIASVTKRITMQPYPHEKVWIKGSVVVTGWVVDGVTWRHTGIPFKFCQNCCNTAAVDPAYPNACRPDQVFLGSNPLVQVASKAAVTAGKFFADYTNNFIYIGTNPGTQVVEVSAKWRAIQFNGGSEGSIVRGLGFAQYAPYWNEAQLAAVISNAASVTFESNAFVQAAGTSLAIVNQPNNIVRNNYIAYNGYRGVVGNKCHGSQFLDNTIDNNNLERFRTSSCGGYCTVAGMKIAHADNLVVSNNYFRSNIGHGFWCDLGCTDSVITKNVATSNTGHGIFYEVSSRAIIASNIMAKNGVCGLKVAGSDALRIYNNVFNRNTINMGIYDDDRSPSTYDPNYSAPLGLTWDTRNLQIVNNLLSNTNGAGVFYDSLPAQVNSREMISVMGYNGWYRSSTTAPTNLMKWCTTTSTASCAPYTNHAQFVSATGLDVVGPSIVVENVATNPFFVNEAAGDYNLLAASKARYAGAPLPADIAGVLGVPASPVDMGALVWRGKTAGPAPAPTTLTFYSSDDATIEQASPDTNLGSDAQLIADNDPRTDFLMKFTVSGVGTRTVTKATLNLYGVDPGAAGAQVYQADHNNWLESSVTWNSAPWILTPEVATLPQIVANTAYSVDVTAKVKADGTYSFRILQPSMEGIRFSSNQGAVKPSLVLNV